MNAKGGPSEARRAKEGASADSAEEMKDTTGVSPWRLHGMPLRSLAIKGWIGCQWKVGVLKIVENRATYVLFDDAKFFPYLGKGRHSKV